MTSSRSHRASRVVGATGKTALLAGAAGAILGTVALSACGATSGIILGERATADAAPSAVDQDAGFVAVVDASSPCADCPVAVTLAGASETAQYGGTTGTASTDTCPGDQALIGFQGFLTAPSVGLTLVGQIVSLCGTLVLDGVGAPAGSIATTAGASLPAYGTSQNDPWTQMCPANEVVVGFSGRSGAALDQVAFECAPLFLSNDGGEALAIGTILTLDAAGGDGGTAFDEPCPSGQIARGTNLRSGDWIDAFGLVCGTPVLAEDGGSQ